jgi:putative tryptophan/tyrosine transport system substrate-binding protein
MASTALLAAREAARAQQAQKPVIGFLGSASTEALQTPLLAFHQGLAESNHVEGRDTVVEYRWAQEHYDRLPALAMELVQRGVTVIVAATLPSALAAKAATTTTPIIFFSGGDPVEQGLVASLNRPGGNLTGACVFINDLGPKQLELLNEVAPKAAAIGFLTNPNNPNVGQQLKGMQDAAGKRIIALQARSEIDIAGAIANLAEQHGDALIVSADPFLGVHYDQIVRLAEKHRIGVVSSRLFAKAGGLIGYGNRIEDAYREVGVYTGRILNGEKPADLPVIRATRFDLVVNLKTTRALGLTIPPSILARADEVIE